MPESATAEIACLKAKAESLAQQLKDHRAEFTDFRSWLERTDEKRERRMENEIAQLRRALQDLTQAVKRNENELRDLRTAFRTVTAVAAAITGIVYFLKNFTDLMR